MILSSGSSAGTAFDFFVPALQVWVGLGIDADIVHLVKVHGTEGTDISHGELISHNVAVMGQVVVQIIQKLENILAIFLAPLREGFANTGEIATGVLEAHAGGQKEGKLQPSHPHLDFGFFPGGGAHQRRFWLYFLEIAADSNTLAQMAAVIELQHRHLAHGVFLLELGRHVLALGQINLHILHGNVFFGQKYAYPTRVWSLLHFIDLHGDASFCWSDVERWWWNPFLTDQSKTILLKMFGQ